MGGTLEHMLTEAKIHKKKLFIKFWGIGSAYCDWDHIYHTRILGKNGSGKRRIEALKEEIEANPLLQDYEFTKPKKEIFDILQIKGIIQDKKKHTKSVSNRKLHVTSKIQIRKTRRLNRVTKRKL